MTKTLKQRATRSVSWIVIGQIISQALRLGSNLILTRLLVPEMFGVMAIVTVIMAGLAMFSDVGLLQSIVQSKRGEEPDYLNTAWTIQIIRGFFIFFIALLSAVGLYYAGQYGYLLEETVYGNTQLPFILAIVSSSAVISAFNSIHIFLLNRKLMLAKSIIIELLSQVVGLIFVITWAWYQRDIWALVLGGLVAAFTKMLLSHCLYLGGQCRFFWDKEAAREIFHFGKWIFLTSILGFFVNRGDKLLLAGLLSPEMLGIFSISALLVGSIQGIVFKLIGSVAFPVLSEVKQLQPERVKELYYKIRYPIDAFCLITAGFLFVSGETIVKFLYDERYLEAGIMLNILALSFVVMRFGVAGQFYLACGKPKIMSILMVVRLLFMVLFIPVGFSINQHIGAVWGLVLASIPGMVLTVFFKKKFGIFDLWNELKVLPIFIIGMFIGFALNETGYLWEVYFNE